MRISELLKLRFWSSSLMVVATVGYSPYSAIAQTPPTSTSGLAKSSDTIETWTRDAEQALRQQNWDSANRNLQVAEALAKQGVNVDPATLQRMQQLRTALTNRQSQPAATAAQLNSALWQARQALAQGDVALAQRKVAEARQSGQNFGNSPDSPEKIEAMIARQNMLAQMARSGDAEQYNRQAAEFLLTQGQEVLMYGDAQTATFLVDLAEKFQVDFAGRQLTPQTLRGQIQALAAAGSHPSMGAVAKLMSQAQLAVDQQNWSEASRLVAEAKAFNIPDTAFPADAVRPWQLELVVNKALKQRGMNPDSNLKLASGTDQASNGVVPADYNSERDQGRNMVVGFPQTENPAVGSGVVPPTGPEEVDLSNVNDSEKLLFRRLQSELFKGRAEADQMMKSDPRQALDRMVGLRSSISNSELSPASMAPLLTIIDRDISEMQRFIQSNLSEIENSEQNSERLERVQLDRERRYEAEQQIQKLTEDYNRLMEKGRFEEAQAIAQQVMELAPDSEFAVLMSTRNQLESNTRTMEALKEDRAQKQFLAWKNAEAAATPMDETQPYQHGDAEFWNDRSINRIERAESRRFSSDAERRIWNKLKNVQVQGNYTGSLAEAMSQLSAQVGENITFDTMALQAESVTASTATVNQAITNPISMESALKVILGSQGLTFVVENEVIKVTSRDAQSKRVFSKTYYVGDLVMPARPTQSPTQMNFITPGNQFNTQNSLLAGMNNNANSMAGQTMAQALGQQAMAQQLPNGQNPFAGMNNPMLMGALSDMGGSGGPQRGMPLYTTMGAPQLGGITMADFQPLINLIQQTIQPDSWQTAQGEGTILPYVPNLTLIVSQTQEIQDEIQDMLTQLRKLNDVQIVVEVRFITLGDTFFEKVGVDFDFKINDNTGLTAAGVNNTDNFNPGVIVGRDAVLERFVPTADLDVGFNQNSVGTTNPIFGGFDPGSAGNFGFAILSDIEVFFLLQASKGDSRTNVTQAPTVTMFNGQSASVSDFSARPFVTSVTPVVGDFAVAQMPIVTIIPEGTTLSVSAVASDDRRFVTLSLVPYFSEITDVREFQFDGSRTVRQTNSSFLDDLLDQVDPRNQNRNDDEDIETVTQGVTLQQPVVAQTTVSTVVSVPDGGTVLMGGIKRLSETRVERGIPFLSNIPYVNRLFKNVGIGRETTNLMMMVTPKIIIQEEEEQRQVGPIGRN